MKENLDVIRRCLTLISRIAARGSCSPDSCHVADTLMELRFALVAPRLGRDTHDQIVDPSDGELDKIHHELNFIDSTSQEFTAFQVLKYAVRSTWN